MRYVRYVALGGVIIGLYLWLSASLVAAAVTTPPDPVATPETLPTSPIMITAYQINGSSLQFVQIYNNSSELVSLEGGQLVYSYTSDAAGVTYTALVTDGYIEPRQHILFAVESVLTDAAYPAHFISTVAAPPTTISGIQFLLPLSAPSTVPVALKTNSAIQQRGKTSTGYSTVTFGDFSGDLYADTLYSPPRSPLLEAVEFLPRAKSCEPFSLDPTCGDYIKFLILPGFSDDMLQDYRLRTDDSAESVTNTFSLAYASRHGDYLLVRLRDDGQILSLSNSGGHVWLEDTYGVMRYDETLTAYVDAGSETNTGQSWALDGVDGVWKWGIPTPTGSNTFPQVLAAGTVVGSEDMTCPTGKYRNPETNRCRSIEEAVNALAACEEGKERNPLTNRCRSLVTATSSSLAPCEEGEERNPETNRCRKLTSSTSSLVPCLAGYERNTETNRCRKVSDSLTTLASPAKAISSSSGDTLRNSLIITAGLGALSYGVYEWRSELRRALLRLVGLVSGK